MASARYIFFADCLLKNLLNLFKIATVLSFIIPVHSYRLSFVQNKQNHTLSSRKSTVNFTVDTLSVVGGVSRFWTSTGFCPPDPHKDVCFWLLSESNLQNLALIAAIPHGGIEYIRIHWLLDSVTVHPARNNGTEVVPVFNFTCLDSIIKLLHQNRLAPGFEMMGNPSNWFTDLENDTQIKLFFQLAFQLASRYIDQFGIEYVSRWLFESWNEPKLRHFDVLNMTVKGFLNYYDAVAMGLKQASPLLRIGGPGGGCTDKFKLSSYCWALLDHIHNGINYFTGRKDVPIDFISIHKKGSGIANTKIIFEKEQNFISELKLRLPQLASKPLYNNEADPEVSWNVSRWWQADATYAGMATKIIVEHQLTSHSLGMDYQLLSNDNAFLSYQPFPFTERTLLARFQINKTDPPHVLFIRKPIYAVMGLLSMVGESQLKVMTPKTAIKFADVNILATVHFPLPTDQHDSWELTVVLYNSADTRPIHGKTIVNLQLLNFLPRITARYSDIKFTTYLVDNIVTNAFSMWTNSGSPPTPDWKLLQKMRSVEEPRRLGRPALWNNTRLQLTLRRPSVALIHFCSKSLLPPYQVTNVRIHNITFNQVLIVWSDADVRARCILTYEVEFSRVGTEGSFRRINGPDTMFTSFTYDVSSARNHGDFEKTLGYYRVRAIDYWDRPSSYSMVTHYPLERF